MAGKNKPSSKISNLLNKGKKFVGQAFVAFSLFEEREPSLTIIASKKIGNAVKRNRSRRRLKALFRVYCGKDTLKNISLVLLARNKTATVEYSLLKKDFSNLLSQLTGPVKK